MSEVRPGEQTGTDNTGIDKESYTDFVCFGLSRCLKIRSDSVKTFPIIQNRTLSKKPEPEKKHTAGPRIELLDLRSIKMTISHESMIQGFQAFGRGD